jgi:hypothetical protein
MTMTVSRRISADEAMSLRRDQVRDGRLLKVASTAPASWDAGKRSARFTMTSEAVDRYGDVVMTDGIDTTQFAKNPQAFFSHNSANWPIGKWTNLQKYLFANPKRMEGDLVLGPAGGPVPEVDQAAWSLQHGLLRSASIGFLPDWSQTEKALDAKGNWDGGLIFHATELLECSLVGIPANPQALAKGFLRARGLHLPTRQEVSQRKREIELLAMKRGGAHGP